ncbi:uncharacterized protein LOC143922518 [Arctopsyche grandis]|uniref:uncharacterized protein LOC143922518 n=1 Tax=Arctopsyche grandis TaxID=121162 RepID=UPI00406D96E0
MAAKNLTGFGVELREIKYKDNIDWLIQFNNCENLWEAQPTFLISQAVYLLGGFLTLIHALRKGGRWPWLWLATICHGLVVEIICYNLPDVDNFWHSQAPIMLFGNRLPLHIILLYPVFIYQASYTVSKLQLPGWAEPFAVGLTTVLIDLPYDIVAVKFLHWTWHDTDPNIADRHYWVPWNSYYFHATFAASFTFWFHLSYNFFGSKVEKWQSKGFFKELRTVLMTSLLGMPGGVLLFIPLYHPLHDLLGIHSEVTFFMLLTLFLVIAWSGDRTQRDRNPSRVGVFDWMLILYIISHYATYLGFTIWGQPEAEVSMGMHEPIGSCSQIVTQKTAFGTVLRKRKYLCMNDYHEDYFSFSCLGGKKPSNGAIWYTVCGTPFRNRNEYIAVIGTICFLAFVVFYNFYFRNYADNKVKSAKDVKKATKQKLA